MTKASNRLASLLHRIGAGRRARSNAFKGATTPKIALASFCALIGTLLVTAAPALAGPPEEPFMGGIPHTATTAELVGVLNPNAEGEAGTYEFLYKKGGACEGGDKVPVPPGSASSEQFEVVSQMLTGLTPGAEYTACILAENAAHEKAQSAPSTFTLLPETPETKPATPITAGEETLHGVLNPAQAGEPETYEFVYRQSPSECQGGEPGEEKLAPQPAEGAMGAKGEAKEVSVTGLLPGTQYTFCLLARNAVGEAAVGNTETFTTPTVAPTVSGEFVSSVEATTATLNASIDPGGAPTTYDFEYLTEEKFKANGETFTGATTTEEAGPTVADDTEHAVEVTLKALTPNTTYHYHVVAENKVGGKTETEDGEDKTFTTPAALSAAAPETCPNAQARSEQPYGTTLPDCRAYEMVSPLNKDGRDILFDGSRASSSDEFPAITYYSQGSFSEPQGSGNVSRYVSRREPEHDRWSLQNITPPITLLNTQGGAPFAPVLFTPELSKGVLLSQDTALVEDEPEGFDNLYVADLASTPASYQTVTNVRPPGVSPYEEEFPQAPKVEGTSSDLSYVVFGSSANLTPSAKGEGEEKSHVYEWADGKLRQVDISPEGTSFEGEDTAGAPGNGTVVRDGDTWHAVSASGLRVFFTAGEGSEQTGQLYVRENPEQELSAVNGQGECTEPTKACTVEVSKSQKTNGTGPEAIQPAYYRDANAEGTRVFFTSRAELTNDANTGSNDNTANLYEYEVSSETGQPGKLTDLTAPTEAEDPDGAAVLGLVTASENVGEKNSYVYFVANGVLASGAKTGDCKEEEEEKLTGEHTCNLYVDHYNNGKWETKFIATLTGGDTRGAVQGVVGDEPDWVDFEKGNSPLVSSGSLTADYGPVQHTVRVTPDGATLAFESERSLTGYDNEPIIPGAGSEGHHCTERGGVLSGSDRAVPCREVFLYDAVAGKLVCASCDPSGVRPVGPAELGGHEDDSVLGDLEIEPFYLARNLSESGRRLFFQSLDPLIPHDTDNLLNVYEWEQPATPTEAANGENSCTQAGGCVFPISDVAGDNESHFMDASPNGNDVFIDTADQLVPSDTDTRRDVYDVRVGGGFPVIPAAVVCNTEAVCKSPVSPQPGVFAPPASATFAGPGNIAPAVAPPPSAVKPKPKSLTRAQKLSAAIKACSKKKGKKRTQCEKRARSKYGPTNKKAKAKKSSNNGRAH